MQRVSQGDGSELVFTPNQGPEVELALEVEALIARAQGGAAARADLSQGIPGAQEACDKSANSVSQFARAMSAAPEPAEAAEAKESPETFPFQEIAFAALAAKPNFPHIVSPAFRNTYALVCSASDAITQGGRLQPPPNTVEGKALRS